MALEIGTASVSDVTGRSRSLPRRKVRRSFRRPRARARSGTAGRCRSAASSCKSARSARPPSDRNSVGASEPSPLSPGMPETLQLGASPAGRRTRCSAEIRDRGYKRTSRAAVVPAAEAQTTFDSGKLAAAYTRTLAVDAPRIDGRVVLVGDHHDRRATCARGERRSFERSARPGPSERARTAARRLGLVARPG